jgi:hypothetical protein
MSTTDKPTDSLRTIPDCGYSEFLANFRINDGSTPIHHAAINDDITSLRILIDFDGNRQLLKLHKNGLSVAAEGIGATNAVKMLREYYPTREQMMKTQLECKLRADAMFQTNRYRQTEIDVKFKPIWEMLYPGLYDAIESGEVDRVDRFMPLFLISEWPRSPMLLFIISMCLKKCSHPAALVHFLCEKFRGSSPLISAFANNCHPDLCLELIYQGFDVNEIGLFDIVLQKMSLQNGFTLNQSAMSEVLLYCGMDPKPWNCIVNHPCSGKTTTAIILHPFQECIKRSQILCLFKILYHKFIFLDIETIYQLLQTLLLEGMDVWEFMQIENA